MFEYKYLKYKNKYFKKKINNISGGGDGDDGESSPSESKCMICLDPINQESVKLLCNHTYHLICIAGLIWTKHGTNSTVEYITKNVKCCICRNDTPVIQDNFKFTINMNNLGLLITSNDLLVSNLSQDIKVQLIAYLSEDLKETYRTLFTEEKITTLPSFQQLLNMFIIRAIIKNELYEERVRLGDQDRTLDQTLDQTLNQTLNAINRIIQSRGNNTENTEGDNTENTEDINYDIIINRNSNSNPINRIVYDIIDDNTINRNSNSNPNPINRIVYDIIDDNTINLPTMSTMTGGHPIDNLKVLCMYIKVYSKYIIYLFSSKSGNIDDFESNHLKKDELKINKEDINNSKTIYNNLYILYTEKSTITS